MTKVLATHHVMLTQRRNTSLIDWNKSLAGRIKHTQLFERKKFTITEPRAPLPPYTITRPGAAISIQATNEWC